MRISVLLIALAWVLSGCGNDSLHQKRPVNAIYIDFAESMYTVTLTTSMISYEQEQNDPEFSCTNGTGVTVQQALFDAQNNLPDKLFYKQCDLLFLGPGLYETFPNKACTELYHALPDLPNVEVYGVLEKPTNQNVKKAMRYISDYRKKLISKIYLYEFTKPSDAVLPLICLGRERVNTCGIAVYHEGAKSFIWDGNKAELGLLLLNKSAQLPLLLGNDKGDFSFKITSPKITYHVLSSENQMNLTMNLYGRIDDVFNFSCEKKLIPQEVSAIINSAMEQELSEMVLQTFAKENDLFRWCFYFANKDTRKLQELQHSKALYNEKNIKIRCNFHMP